MKAFSCSLVSDYVSGGSESDVASQSIMSGYSDASELIFRMRYGVVFKKLFHKSEGKMH